MVDEKALADLAKDSNKRMGFRCKEHQPVIFKVRIQYSKLEGADGNYLRSKNSSKRVS